MATLFWTSSTHPVSLHDLNTKVWYFYQSFKVAEINVREKYSGSSLSLMMNTFSNLFLRHLHFGPVLLLDYFLYRLNSKEVSDLALSQFLEHWNRHG